MAFEAHTFSNAYYMQSSPKLFIPMPNSEYFHRFVNCTWLFPCAFLAIVFLTSQNGFRGAKAWNDLPVDTEQASSLNSFIKYFQDFL